MGKKSSSSESKPPKEFMPFMMGGARSAQDAYNQNAGSIQNNTDSINGMFPDLVANYRQGDAGVNAARGYVTDTLGRDPTNNPYMEQMLADSNGDIRNQMQAAMGAKGLTGGSSYADLITRGIAKNTLATRYQNYEQEMQRKAQAAGMAPGLSAADNARIAPLLAAQQAGMMPLQASGMYTGSLGGLLGGYVKQTQNPSTGSSIAQGIGTVASLASLFSDARLKTDVRRVGQTDAGVPIYTYRYLGEGPYQMGVMAQDIEELLPEAAGPRVEGFRTVFYEGVR